MKKSVVAICVISIFILCLLCACDPNPAKQTYTVTFDSQGGSAVESQTVVEGNLVKKPQSPTREGYIFNGWYTTSAATTDTQWRFDTDCVTKDLTLYAGWTDETSQEIPPEQEVTKMYITINGNKLEVTLADNSSVKELVDLLKQGNITYTANDYGEFEKVGSIGHTLGTNDSPITTEPGDVVLYLGNQICIMVGSNSWSYTRIGKISGYSVSELKNLVGVGKGSVEVTLSLE